MGTPMTDDGHTVREHVGFTTRDGAAVVLAFCNFYCGEQWLAEHRDDTDVTAPRQFEQAVPRRNFCAQCSWCGATVADPVEDCLLHGDECPPAVWEMSQQAAECALELVAICAVRGMDVHPGAWVLAASLAASGYGAEQDGDALARIVWDGRATWAECADEPPENPEAPWTVHPDDPAV